MKNTAQRHELPYEVRRCIKRYIPELRAEITSAVQKKMDELGRMPTSTEIGTCASAVVFAGTDDYDHAVENLCLKAYHAGRYRPLREVIDELRASSE